ncbi:MAG: PDZ domain-containing protein [Deltaproteobacteria bacterium]|nr:PDZ domain-containing protein [Deltaproteobacteria bacterium]MBW2118244.1 PDZ domain-containing protein [Deltaproteobacteria bacterium]MBW2345004.1 PDZ domain-containing protein [Deltaproteobacteria bacterium]
MNPKAKWAVLVILSFVFLIFAGLRPWSFAQEQVTFKPLFPVQPDHDFPEAERTFEEIKNLILNHYYSDSITREALYWAAIKGMLRQISPPDNPELSKIWTPEEYERVLLSLKGTLIAIGMKSSFDQQEGSLTVTEVLPGSPAEAALKPLDRILRINSQPLKGESLRAVNALLEGEEGTEVTLTVNRDIEVFDVIIKRRKFETQSLIITRLTDNIALVEIKGFTSNVSRKLGAELEKLKNEGFRGLIIDFRNNLGGIFSESLRVTELFLPENKVLLRTVQRETGLQNYISGNKEPFTFELAVLVNSQTASSAEIVAGAFQDHQKAVIVGTRTFGKAVIEKTHKLGNDFRVKFITSAMYSPKGRTWQGKGITPDFLVEQDEKTLAALLKMHPKKRFARDVAMITAYKLLTR